MKTAIALPLVSGSSYISAYTPPTTEIGLLALIPVNDLKINRAAKLGAKAQAIVNIVKRKNVEFMITFLPYVSDRGPNSKGPRTYPIRYIDIGRI